MWPIVTPPPPSQYYIKGTVSREKVFKLRLWGDTVQYTVYYRLYSIQLYIDSKVVTDLNFIFLRCLFASVHTTNI